MSEPNDGTNDVQMQTQSYEGGDQATGGSAAATDLQQKEQQQPPQHVQHTKVDKITALQNGIDSLSLSMFEALRKLRDAVAPESGNLGDPNNPGGGGANNNNNGANNNNSDQQQQQDSFEEFYSNYHNGDPETLRRVESITSAIPRRREDFEKLHKRVEQQKDEELVERLAREVLDKSVDIDERVSALPGMDRTKSQQMAHIEALLKQNQQVCEKLQIAYDEAHDRRDLVRKFVRDNTCAALGIAEDKE